MYAARLLALLALGFTACGDEVASTPDAGMPPTSSVQTPPSATPSVTAVPAPPPTVSVSASSEPAPTSSAVPSSSAQPNTTSSPVTSATATPTVTPSSTATEPPVALEGAEAVARDVDTVFQPVKRYKAKFIQKYRQKVSGKDKESTGTLLIERPNRFSFRYDAPNKNRIVSDGKLLKIYSAEDATMYERPSENSELPDAFAFLTGAGIRTRMTFTFNDKAKFALGPVLIGKPKAATPHYESMLFYIDKANLEKKSVQAMAGILILDVQGNRNRFEFSEASEPATVDAGEFTFTPPAGTDIKR
jgi:outer membrane lipoprotein carrier protein